MRVKEKKKMRVLQRSGKMMVTPVLVASLLAGCGSASTTPSVSTSPASSTAPTPTAAVKQPPTTLKIVVREAWPGVPYDNKSIHYIEQQTNTKLEITAIDGSQLDNKLNIMLASGDHPDIIQFSADDTEWKYSKSNLLLPLNQYFDKAPNLKKIGDDGIWDAMKHEDGNVYAIPIRGSSIDNIPIYRKDWLDKLGMKVPTTPDEYFTVADAIANKDPDGDGKKNTFALGGYTVNGGFDLATYDHIFGAYGTLPNFWISQDSKIVNGSVASGALDALKFMNKLYKDKAVDPEFVTDNQARMKDKLLKGVIGAPVFRYFTMDPSNLNNYYAPLKQNNPNAEFIEGGILKASDKSIGPRTLTKRGWLKTAIVKDSKNIDAALRLLDYLASDKGNKFVNYGEEGKDYTVENNVVKRTINDDQLKQEGIGQFTLAYNALFEHTSKRFQDLMKYAVSIGYKSPVDGIFIQNNTKESELNIYTTQQYAKMIMNDGPIDNMFNDFVAEWNKRGGTDLTKAYNDAYQAKNKK